MSPEPVQDTMNHFWESRNVAFMSKLLIPTQRMFKNRRIPYKTQEQDEGFTCVDLNPGLANKPDTWRNRKIIIDQK